MAPFQDRRVLALGGAGVALVAAIGFGVWLSRSGPSQAPLSNSQGELRVVMSKTARLDPNAQLRCFVGGQFVGMLTSAQCAERNGVAPGSLDVGLDQSGALAAGASGAPLQPLPAAPPNDQLAVAGGDAAASGPSDHSDQGGADQADGGEQGEAGCLRYSPRGWRGAAAGSLDECVHVLFDGSCVQPGEAIYGMWRGQTLRLAPGRVEISPDGRSFRTLVEQDPDCSIPSL